MLRRRKYCGFGLWVTCATLLAGCGGAPGEPVQDDDRGGEIGVIRSALTFDFELRIHIIALQDDSSGTNATTTTTADIQDFVGLANQVFAPASVHFTFDPAWDWTVLVDTDLNQNLDANNSGNNWGRANTIAAKYPGKIVIFLRNRAQSNFAYPPNTGQAVPIDSALPSPQPNFIAHDGVRAVALANRQNFSHEIGHFLGLYHTHLGWSNSIGTTDAAIISLQRTRGANALDGDLVADTPQDPGPAYWTNKGWQTCDPNRASTTVKGVTYTPDRANVMGYFGCFGGTNLSNGQVQMVRASLSHESRRILHEAPCFPDFNALPIEQFQTCFDYWVTRGLWPQTLSVSPNGSRISGSLQSGPFRGLVRHYMTATEYDQQVSSLDPSNWVVKDLSISKLASGEKRYTAIFEPSGGSDVTVLREQTASAFNNSWSSLYNAGYTQTDWYIHGHDSGGIKVSSSWVKRSPFLGFAAHYGLAWSDYTTFNQQFTNQGLRVSHFVGYPDAGTRYAAIWEPSNLNRFVSLSSSSAAYQTDYNRILGQYGYRLHQINMHGSDSYAAIWVGPHDLCTTGARLLSESDPCATSICGVDPYCCNTAWDSICVGEVGSVCGRSCP